MHETDVLIVGAGIVGLAIARELYASGIKNITLIEKEPALGCHASGRNSGVLHAGIYYPPNTLKAKLCLEGNRLMQAYCKARGLPLVNSGKVIVARNESELLTLQTLYERAKENGARVELLDEAALLKIEPHAKTVSQAIYSHDTAVVDNRAILKALSEELIAASVKILLHTAFKHVIDDHTVQTSQGKIRFQFFINAAGAYSDQVAKAFGVGSQYYFIPFKGIYKKLHAAYAHLVRGNIYPVPHLGNPFLGVHFTRNISGDVYVGPTAIPAFGRENYGLLAGIDTGCLKILLTEGLLYFSNAEFRKVAHEEPKKYWARYFYQDAKQLVKSLSPDWLIPASKVGIRPQLVDMKEKKLMMDFLVIRERASLHILNAISPAFTSSLAFAKYLVQHYI